MKLINQYKRLSVHTKAALWFVFCSILQKGISFITVPIFTRLMSPEQYGEYSLYLSWLQIFTIVTSLYLYYGVFNNAMVKFEKDRDRYISSMQGLTITICFIFLILFLIFNNLFRNITGLSSVFLILMIVEMFFTPSIGFWSGHQRFEYKYKLLVLVTILKSLINPILGFFLVISFTNKSLARVISVVFAEVLVCGVIMIYQFIKGKTFFSIKYWKYALSLAIPLLPHYLSSMVLNQGDRIVISKIVGNSAVAFYSVAYSLGMIVQIFTNALSNSFTPYIYEKLKKEKYNDIKKSINILLLLVFGIISLVILCSPEIIKIFGSSEYSSAVYVVAPVAASVFFIFLYNLLAIPQFYFEKTKFMLFSSILSAVVNVILNIIFIKIFGYIAAAYTTLICYILYSYGHFVISNRLLKKVNEKSGIFDDMYIVFLSIMLIILVLISNFLFKFILIRYIIILLIFILLIIFKDKILKFVFALKNKDSVKSFMENKIH